MTETEIPWDVPGKRGKQTNGENDNVPWDIPGKRG